MEKGEPMRTPKPYILIVLFCTLALFAFRVHAAEEIDYQKTADGAGWGWLAEMDNPLGCVAQCGGKYNIKLVSPHDDRYALTISVLVGDRGMYSWKGHRHSVFRILDDRLYYAKFHPSSSGGSIVAVDLTTGKELWTSELRALGNIEHSAYRTLLNLDCNREVVTIWGNETLGRYVEFKRVDTGQTVGHRMFRKESSETRSYLKKVTRFNTTYLDPLTSSYRASSGKWKSIRR
jgi:hypothetical protein